MALRMVEIFIPTEKEKQLRELLEEHQPIDIWSDRISESRTLVRMLVPSEDTEAVLDILEARFSYLEEFRIVLLPVAACIPRPGAKAGEKEKEAETAEEEKPPEKKLLRISREELYANIDEFSKLTKIYAVMVILSTIVAAIGIMRSNVAIIVGAMVIAPLLGPNVALSFATTLGDIKLARRALKSNLVGILFALAVAVLVGLFFFKMDRANLEVMTRTHATLSDIALALAAGSAGALSLTVAAPAALIGVMVAVALLPPLVVFGMLIGAGEYRLALGAMLLLLVNLICINLAGVLTFLLQGVRPRTWWEADRAKKSTRIAIALWVILLAALAVLILLSQRS
jgi:uncharacterized hydrophobic protein (TIGR00341 family)